MPGHMPHCFANRKRGRDPMCSAGDIVSIAPHISGRHVGWGTTTSQRWSVAQIQAALERLREAGRKARAT